MVNRFILAASLVLAVALTAPMAMTSLVPMSWGFPVMVQNDSLTGFQTSFQSANDLETADISFPDSTGGLLGTSFPTISQLTQQGSLLSQISMSNQQQSMLFAYPWISIGGSPVPSMGLL